MRWLVAAFLAIAFVLGGAMARADDTTARANDLKKSGDKAMDALRYDDAIAAYTEAYALSHDPTVIYNRGRVHQARADYPQALDDLERFEREASPELLKRVPRLAPLLAELRAKVAVLTIKCEMAGARVLLREKVIGETPIASPIRTNAGPAVIEVTREGFTPFREETDLKGGATTVIEAKLVKVVPLQAVLVVRAVGALDVTVDGARLGKPPVETTVNPGTHRVTAEGDGVEPSSTSVVVAAGERKEVSLELAHRPSVVSRWWFWTGAAVVVAAGVVLTYAVLTEKSAPSGDHFSPSHVQSSLVAW
jgi:hypothetical protein